MSSLSIAVNEVATSPPRRVWHRPPTLAARNVSLTSLLDLIQGSMLAYLAFFGASAFLP